MSLHALAAALRAAVETLEAHLEAEELAPPAAAPAKRTRAAKTPTPEQSPPASPPAPSPTAALAPAAPVTGVTGAPPAAAPVVPPSPPPAPSTEPPDSTLVKKASDAISLLANEYDRDEAVKILAKRVVGTTADGKPIPAKKLSQLPFLKDTWQAVLDELEEAIEKARAKQATVSLV